MQGKRLAVTALVATSLLAGVAGAEAAPVDVVAEGLDNPRGLAFAPEGSLYVAEAGRGGDGACVRGPDGSPMCLGATGAITRIRRGVQSRVEEGLPSLASSDGSAAIGPHDVAFLGTGTAAMTIGLGQPPARRAGLGPDGRELGTVARIGQGQKKRLADLAAFEEDHDPAGDRPDSNPYGLLQVDGTRYATDAGGNSLLALSANGRLRTVTTFPARFVPFGGGDFRMQSVPTAVAEGADGQIYVGELTGFPFPEGRAQIYRVAPDGSTTVAADGFSNIIDVTGARDGGLYVLEFATHGILEGSLGGALHHVAADGTRTTIAGPDVLFAPGGVAEARDGDLYVTDCSICPGSGRVLELDR